jgi:hypothetical protein
VIAEQFTRHFRGFFHRTPDGLLENNTILKIRAHTADPVNAAVKVRLPPGRQRQSPTSGSHTT